MELVVFQDITSRYIFNRDLVTEGEGENFVPKCGKMREEILQNPVYSTNLKAHMDK